MLHAASALDGECPRSCFERESAKTRYLDLCLAPWSDASLADPLFLHLAKLYREWQVRNLNMHFISFAAADIRKKKSKRAGSETCIFSVALELLGWSASH